MQNPSKLSIKPTSHPTSVSMHATLLSVHTMQSTCSAVSRSSNKQSVKKRESINQKICCTLHQYKDYHQDDQHCPQLPGLTPQHVALVAATGLLLLFAYSYLHSDTSLPMRQSKCWLFEVLGIEVINSIEYWVLIELAREKLIFFLLPWMQK